MSEGAFAGSIVAKKPDYASALIALDAAYSLLETARERLHHEDVRGALESSRDAIRMASSAILFRDGYVAASLEATADYISKKYPGLFPVGDWDMVEVTASGHLTLYRFLLSAMGRLKKSGRQEADRAVSTAESFLETARSELGP